MSNRLSTEHKKPYRRPQLRQAGNLNAGTQANVAGVTPDGPTGGPSMYTGSP